MFRSTPNRPGPTTLLVDLQAPHGEVGRVENELRSAHFAVLGTDYAGPQATITVGLDDGDDALEHFNARLASMTAGELVAAPVGTQWQDLA